MSRLKAEYSCADCGLSDPGWVSINRGVLVCDDCCSVHRKLGRHVSHIKCFKKGQWPPTQLAMVKELVKLGVNNIWEHALLESGNKRDKRKPTPPDPVYNRKYEFILAKYKNLSFLNKPKDSESASHDEVNQQLFATVRSAELQTSFRLLSLGADPNYWHPQRQRSPLHVAAESGQTLQCELLLAHGADPAAPDGSGSTPASLAVAKSHSELAARLVESQHELTDRLTHYLCGNKPDHRSGQHLLIPEVALSSIDTSEFARRAKERLQTLPNTLLEELAMDVYDEVDRREIDTIWLSIKQSPAAASQRTAIPHLPVNPHLSQARNQGRQKLGRLSARELATLILDVLGQVRDRQQMSGASGRCSVLRASAYSDAEPLYDTPPDEDYQSLDSLQQKRPAAHPVVSAEESELFLEAAEGSNHSGSEMLSGLAESHSGEVSEPRHSGDESNELRRALQASEVRVAELTRAEQQLLQELRSQQQRVQLLEAENLQLRGQMSRSPVESVSEPRRMRPVSMFEATDARRVRGSLRLSPLPPNRSCASSPASQPSASSEQRLSAPGSDYDNDPASGRATPDRVISTENIWQLQEGQSPGSSADHRQEPEEQECLRELAVPVSQRTEQITQHIQALLQAAQTGSRERVVNCTEDIEAVVTDMSYLFSEAPLQQHVSSALQRLQNSAQQLSAQCRLLSASLLITQPQSGGTAASVSQQIVGGAYEVAKATKQLVMLFPVASS